jgi:hypothetical protein
MPDKSFDAAGHVDRMAAAVGLTIAPEYRDGVIANMARTAEIARLVTEFPLPDDAGLAPAFHPGERHGGEAGE